MARSPAKFVRNLTTKLSPFNQETRDRGHSRQATKTGQFCCRCWSLGCRRSARLFQIAHKTLNRRHPPPISRWAVIPHQMLPDHVARQTRLPRNRPDATSISQYPTPDLRYAFRQWKLLFPPHDLARMSTKQVGHFCMPTTASGSVSVIKSWNLPEHHRHELGQVALRQHAAIRKGVAHFHQALSPSIGDKRSMCHRRRAAEPLSGPR